MEAYTVYEVTRRSDSEYPTFFGLQIEDEEIIDRVDVEADHSNCESFYCENCKATYSHADKDEIETKDWGFACSYDGVHSHAICQDCGAALCDGPHRAGHRSDEADVIRVKITGCGAQFEQQMNSRDEVVEYKEIERNWFDSDNLSETPIVKRDGRWLQLLFNYNAPPCLDESFQCLTPCWRTKMNTADEVAWLLGDGVKADMDDGEMAAIDAAIAAGKTLFVASDEDGFYFAVEVNY